MSERNVVGTPVAETTSLTREPTQVSINTHPQVEFVKNHCACLWNTPLPEREQVHTREVSINTHPQVEFINNHCACLWDTSLPEGEHLRARGSVLLDRRRPAARHMHRNRRDHAALQHRRTL